MHYYVYKHTSPSGKSYIGITNNLSVRDSSHKSGDNGCTAFNQAVKKYGWNAFTHEIIACCLSPQDALHLECLLVLEHNTQSPNGYNLSSGGEGGWTHSDESKAKMSKSRTGLKQSDATKQKKREALLGRTRPDSVKQLISERTKGKQRSQETKDAMSARRKGKPNKHLAKTWLCISPDGTEFVVVGLQPFCKQYNLDSDAMRKVANGKCKHHKGWKCQRT